MSYQIKAPTIPFTADPDKCTPCGACVEDCVTRVISIENNVAVVPEDKRDGCLGCQHCLAICPTGAASVDGYKPENSAKPGTCDPEALASLMRSRRSIRQFAPEPVDRALFDKVLKMAAFAPTGGNQHTRRFTAILDKKVMDDFRDRVSRAAKDTAFPEALSFLSELGGLYVEKGVDVLFRHTPHLLVVTADKNAITPVADCIIALTYFELAAQANGLATIWGGFPEMVLQHVPEARRLLGIPDDHLIGYAMMFGRSAIKYARTAQHEPEAVSIIDKLQA